MSRTNINIDDKILNKAMNLTKKKTKTAVVNYALEDLVRREEAKGILHLIGKIRWNGNLNELRRNRI